MTKVKIYLVLVIGLLTVVVTGIDGLDSVMKDYFVSNG
jgi:hypothetical protein